MITLLVAGVLLVLVGSGGNAAMACDGCCGSNYGGVGLFGNYQPAVTYYAPYPIWWPNYFGPPYTDYQVVHYVTPPAVTAEVVKERIAAINAANPLMLPVPEPLPSPRDNGQLPPADKVAPKKK